MWTTFRAWKRWNILTKVEFATSIRKDGEPSPDGIKVCRDLGFEEFDDPVPGSTRKRFVMDVATSHSMLLEEYHEVIKKQHSKQAVKSNS